MVKGDAAVVKIDVQRLDGRPPLRIEHAELVAEVFFRLDASSRPGGYDDYIRTNANWGDRIVEADIGAINKTMRARSRSSAWSELISAGHLDWLDAIGRDWDLFAIDEPTWLRERCSERLANAFEGIKGRYRGRATVTKLLHLKRPAFVPVCDSLVEFQLGVTISTDSVVLVEFIRRQGRRNLTPLLEIQSSLARRGIQRTLVRVFDALLWSTHPSSEFGPLPGLLRDWAASRVIAR